MQVSPDSTFVQLASTRGVVTNALKIALVVGTLLGMINHGPALLNGTFSSLNLAQVLVTYLVPYSVSTWSAVRAIRRFCM